MFSSTQLRPLNIGEILDAAFRRYRAHLVTFLGITALLQVPMLILQVLIQHVLNGGALLDVALYSTGGARSSSVSPFNGFPIRALIAIYLAAFGLSMLQYLVVYNLLNGALAQAIARSFRDEPVAILDAYRIGWRAFFSLVVASLVPLLTSLLVLIPIIAAAFAVGIGLAARGQNAATLTAVVAVLVGSVIALALLCGAAFLYVRLLFATQAVVFERCGPIQALRRSWNMTRGAFWRTLLIVVLMATLTYLVSSLPALVVNLVLTFTGGTGNLLRNSLITTLITQVGIILALPLQLCTYTLLYYDQRVRREGLDIELRAQIGEAALA